MSALIDSVVRDAVDRAGFATLRAVETRSFLAAGGKLGDWQTFAESWNDLALDRYMGDGGTYRRRRYAVYSASADGRLTRAPHQPHFQSRDYNSLNGGVARWFEPIEPAVGSSATMTAMLRAGTMLFAAVAPTPARSVMASASPSWAIEVHQFRIEALAGSSGRPTPEGVHRDGVDYVLVVLVHRENVASGTTTLHDLHGHVLAQFTLEQPLDAVLLDDHRLAHGVTPIEAIDPAAPAYRDVLVATWRRTPAV